MCPTAMPAQGIMKGAMEASTVITVTAKAIKAMAGVTAGTSLRFRVQSVEFRI